MYNANNMTMRMTHQTKQVLQVANQLGHATNAEILLEVKKQLPNISATTIHRITTRLVINNMLALGPELNGSMTLDANTNQHDHFICKDCDGIKDIKISDTARKELQQQVDALLYSSVLSITGNCHQCKER